MPRCRRRSRGFLLKAHRASHTERGLRRSRCRPDDNQSMDEVFGLFPTPFMRAPGTLSQRLVDGLVKHFSGFANSANKASGNLLHTEMLRPGDSELLVEAASLIMPKIVDMGALMFGERLGWSI